MRNDFLLRPFTILGYGLAVLCLVGIVIVGVGVLSSKSKDPIKIQNQYQIQNPTQNHTWIYKATTVCQEIWQQKKLTPEIYFKSQGVEVFDTITRRTGAKACNDCDCLSGETLYLKVDTDIIIEGFTQSPTDPEDK